MNMLAALVILVLLILATPVTIIFDGPIVVGLLAAAGAVSVAIVGVRIRPGEAGFLSMVIRPVAIAAAIPAIWMLIQAMPLQGSGSRIRFGKRGGSTWAATGRKHQHRPRRDTISFVRYLSATAIAFVAAAVAIDRRRAEWVFFALTMATTLIALMAAGGQLWVSFSFQDFWQMRRSGRLQPIVQV